MAIKNWNEFYELEELVRPISYLNSIGMLIKAREPKIRSANDFIDDKGLDSQSNSVDDGTLQS
jgi:hypothetical protein